MVGFSESFINGYFVNGREVIFLLGLEVITALGFADGVWDKIDLVGALEVEIVVGLFNKFLLGKYIGATDGFLQMGFSLCGTDLGWMLGFEVIGVLNDNAFEGFLVGEMLGRKFEALEFLAAISVKVGNISMARAMQR